MSAPWGEAHRREALRRTYEIAAELALTYPPTADLCAHEAIRFAFTETIWRGGLRDCGLDRTRIDREVRRVRALAEGRLVRETASYIARRGTRLGLYDSPDDARNALRDWKRSDANAVVLRVARIRRAP